MSQFNYVGSGNPSFGGPAAAPALYLDKANRVIWVWDGTSGVWIPEVGTNVSVDNITALGTNQATGTVLSMATAYNITSMASATGVVLPVSWTGAEIAVNNNTATANGKIYPNGAETINGAASLTMAANTIVILYCFTKGAWFTK